MAKKQLDEDLLVSGGASSAQHSKSAKAAAAKQKRAAKAKARYDKKKEALNAQLEKAETDAQKEKIKAKLRALEQGRSGHGLSKKAKKVVAWVVTVVVVVALLCTYVATGAVRNGFLAYLGTFNNMTVATVTDGTDKIKVSLGQYNYYFAAVYNNYKSLASQYETYGLNAADYGMDVDFSKKLSSQMTTDPDDDSKEITWLERIQQETLDTIRTNYMYYNEAVKANDGKEPSITEDQQTELDDALDQYRTQAQSYGYTLSAYLVQAMGKGVTESVFTHEMTVSYIAQNYSDSLSDTQAETYTQEDYDAYLNEHRSELETVSVRIFEADSEEDAQAFESALAADGSNFADLAVQYSSSDLDKMLNADPHNTQELYATRSMLENSSNAYALADADEDGNSEGLDWLFSTDRKAGDTARFSTTVVYVISPVSLSDVQTVNVRHILIAPETESGTASDATADQWSAAYEKAQSVLQQWQNGDATEDSFAELAKENSSDGSAEDGGLYENVYPGQMVSNFGNWCFDSARQAGDTAIVQSQYGYHIMYFVGQTGTPVWEYTAQQALASDDSQSASDALDEKYTVDTNWLASRFFEKDTDIDFGG